VLKLAIKKLCQTAIIPQYTRPGDAGLDLTATSINFETRDDLVNGAVLDYIEYGIGLAVEIPSGYVGLIMPRSSLSKYDLSLANHVGVIDSNYRGEIKLRFKVNKLAVDTSIIRLYNIGDRIGQLVIIATPEIKIIEVATLTTTARANAGFGSSGS